MSLETYRLETVLTNLAGGRSVYRGDVLGGVLINYVSAEDYTLETRLVRDGRRVFMVNKSSYAKAEDIPLTYRKARRVAKVIEANLDLLISGIRGVN
jgi:hypothetical protein